MKGESQLFKRFVHMASGLISFACFCLCICLTVAAAAKEGAINLVDLGAKVSDDPLTYIQAMQVFQPGLAG